MTDKLPILRTIKLRKKKALKSKSQKMSLKLRKSGQTASQATSTNLIRIKLKAILLRRNKMLRTTTSGQSLQGRARNSPSPKRRAILTASKTNKCLVTQIKN